jgi:hypothetical protein
VALSEDAFNLIGLQFSYDQKNADYLVGKKLNPTSQVIFPILKKYSQCLMRIAGINLGILLAN